MIAAYVEWREACRSVDDAYSSWADTTRSRARAAFLQYDAALDAEESAANRYARSVTRVADMTDPPWRTDWRKSGSALERLRHERG